MCVCVEMGVILEKYATLTCYLKDRVSLCKYAKRVCLLAYEFSPGVEPKPCLYTSCRSIISTYEGCI